MIAYSYYESDNRIRRYSEELLKQGHKVDFIGVKRPGQRSFVQVDGVNVYKIQTRRNDNSKGKWGYLFKLLRFFLAPCFL
jgi:hypothetical protein